MVNNSQSNHRKEQGEKIPPKDHKPDQLVPIGFITLRFVAHCHFSCYCWCSRTTTTTTTGNPSNLSTVVIIISEIDTDWYRTRTAQQKPPSTPFPTRKIQVQ